MLKTRSTTAPLSVCSQPPAETAWTKYDSRMLDGLLGKVWRVQITCSAFESGGVCTIWRTACILETPNCR
jgi:hypothetical protein